MFDFLENIAPENAEQISDKRADKIRAAVLSRIDFEKEENSVKKHFTIKPLLLAAAITATGAASIFSASAATNGQSVIMVDSKTNMPVNSEKAPEKTDENEELNGEKEVVPYLYFSFGESEEAPDAPVAMTPYQEAIQKVIFEKYNAIVNS